MVLQVSKPPPWVFDDAWNGTVTVLETRKLLPKLPRTALQEKPPEPPPIEGCADVHRVQGFPVEFPVLLEAITACRTSDAILVATLSGAWQGQEGVAGSDALIRLLLDTGSRSGTPTATETVGDQTAVPPTAPPPASTAAMPGGLARLVPDTLPLGNAPCLPAGDGVNLDFATLVTRFPGVPDAATTSQTLGALAR